MSLCKSTILKSEVTSTPVKLKYSQDLSCGGELGMQFLKGVNGPVSETGSISQETLLYRSIRQLYYMNYVSGSLLGTGSAWDSNWQSTAASGTFEYDNRYFPTQSNAEISVLSIPRIAFGERIAATSFNFSNYSCSLVDDGNGNVIDSQNENIHVGNIIYAQGIVVITHEDYQEVFPRRPHVMDHYREFDQYDVKEFDMLVDEDPGNGEFDFTTLKLFGTNQSHLYTVNTETGHVTLHSDEPGDYYTYYSVKNTYNTGCSLESNTALCKVKVFKDLNCLFSGSIWQNDCRVSGSVRFNYCDLLGNAVFIPPPTPSITPTISITPSITKTPSTSRTPSKTPTVTPSVTPSISITPSRTPSISLSPTISISKTPFLSDTPSVTPTISLTATVSDTPGASKTPSTSYSNTPSVTPTISKTPSTSRTPSVSRTPTPSLSPTRTITPTLSRTPSATPAPAQPSTAYVSYSSTTATDGGAQFSIAVYDPATNGFLGYVVNIIGSGFVTWYPGSTDTFTSALLPLSNKNISFAVVASPSTNPDILISSATLGMSVSGGGTLSSTNGVSSFTWQNLTGAITSLTFNTRYACYVYVNTSGTSQTVTYTNCSGGSVTSTVAANGTICARHTTPNNTSFRTSKSTCV